MVTVVIAEIGDKTPVATVALEPARKQLLARGADQERMMTDELSDLDLVKWYFNVCSTALATPNANVVGNFVESLVLRATPNRFIAVELVDDEDRPLGHYTTRFVDGQFGPVDEGKRDVETRFRLRRSFLRAVVDHSDDYVEHPEKLDWSWIRPG